MAARLRAFPWLAHLPLPSVQAQGDIKKAVEPLATEIIEYARRNANTSAIKGKDLLSILRTLVIVYLEMKCVLTFLYSAIRRNDRPLSEG